MLILKRNDQQVPFLVSTPKRYIKTYGGLDDMRYTSFDTASIWAHNINEIFIPDTWHIEDGYIENTPAEVDKIDKTILIYGGSTSDLGFQAYSWPFHIDKLFKEKNLSVKIYIGAAGGYATAQELMRLIRDIRGINPDIVLSYNGVNEVDNYLSEHPMVSEFANSLYQKLFGNEPTQYMPNTYLILRKYFRSKNRIEGVVIGKPHQTSKVQNWFDNLKWMKLISNSVQAQFISILQPNIAVGKKILTEEEKIYLKDTNHYNQNMSTLFKEFYRQAIPIVKKTDYILDFTDIFTGMDTIYQDVCHVNEEANIVIAENIFKSLQQENLL